MRTKIHLLGVLILLQLMALSLSAQSTEFTYQGQLQSSAAAANGNFDFEFALFDAGGAQIGPVIGRSGVVVSNGFFAVNLDFVGLQ